MKLRLLAFCAATAHALSGIGALGADAPAADTAPTAPAADTAANNSKTVPQSVFTVPTTPAEGRNPFFPKSGGGAATNRTAQTANTIVLVLNGFGGTPAKPLVIINNRTFGEGEEAEVASGSLRAKIRCVEIKADSAVVEMNGERQELHLRSGN